MQFGQIASDAWKKKGVNGDEKQFNICVNLPDGKCTFVKCVPTDGSVALTTDFIQELLTSSGVEVGTPQHPLRESYALQCACHFQQMHH